MNRLQKAQNIALGATALEIIGFLMGNGEGFWYFVGVALVILGFVLGIVSYFFCGIGTAVRMAKKIAKWGFIVAPFPYHLIFGMASFFIAIYVFVLVPIIPVRKAYKESMC